MPALKSSEKMSAWKRDEFRGMLWQTDATPYPWLGEEAGVFTLHAVIDDATGIVAGDAFTTERARCRLRAGNAMCEGIALRETRRVDLSGGICCKAHAVCS